MATGGSRSGTVTIAGYTIALADSVASGTGAVENVATLAAAQPGTLSTRTSGTAGTLTMTSSGHGITTGARLDIYWPTTTTAPINTAGVAYGATVGTVSGTSVPFTLATGDALPLVTTAITAMVPTSVTCSVTGANAVAVGGGCDTAAFVAAFTQSNDTAICHVRRTGAGGEAWLSGQTLSSTNPVTGVTVGKIYVSHGDSTGSNTVKGLIAYT